jgi:hypothetical protein
VTVTAEDYKDAKLVLGLSPATVYEAPDACGWCGREGPPGGKEDMSHGGPPVFTCRDTGDCVRERDAREPAWAGEQFPDWKRDYQRYLDNQRKYIEWQRQRAWGALHREQLAAQERQLGDQEEQLRVAASVAAELRPPDSFFSDLAAALAARRGEPALLELASPGGGEPGGVFGETYDQPSGAPAGWSPDPWWSHSMRNPANRSHTLGHALACGPGPHGPWCQAPPSPPPPAAPDGRRRGTGRARGGRGAALRPLPCCGPGCGSSRPSWRSWKADKQRGPAVTGPRVRPGCQTVWADLSMRSQAKPRASMPSRRISTRRVPGPNALRASSSLSVQVRGG